MKMTLEEQKMQELLSSDILVAGGFLGVDNRTFLEIIDEDSAVLEQLGVTRERIAEKMTQLTEMLTKGLGTWMKLSDNYEGRVEEAKGAIACPWSHGAGLFRKRVTIIKRLSDGENIIWSDLSIHLIKEHGFFQGRGSMFRIEPQVLVKLFQDLGI